MNQKEDKNQVLIYGANYQMTSRCATEQWTAWKAIPTLLSAKPCQAEQ